jgi:ornithine cyclodeaminase/alanine dehydrogenase-like protein (mu-crystallin family)
MKTPLLYLSADDVRRALPMSAAIEAMREAFRQLSNGQVTLPMRERLDAPGERAVALVMPCHSVAEKLFSVKFVTVFQENPRRGLPSIQALVILTDAATGEHLAVMDGASVTAIRTGAASGVATDVLARLEAAVVAADMTQQLGLPVERRGTPAETLEDADVICTATTSTTPVFEDRQLAPGAHVNAVGSFRPDVTEIPSATVCRARVVVDHRASALEEAGDLIGPLSQGLVQQSHVSTELGEILLGRSPGRRSDSEITLFKSVGVAIQDLCAAARALENARRIGLGLQLT